MRANHKPGVIPPALPCLTVVAVLFAAICGILGVGGILIAIWLESRDE